MMEKPIFLDLHSPFADEQAAAVVVLPIPYEATVSYGRGTAEGPEAILTASAQVELYDEELGFEPFTGGIATAEAPSLRGVAPQELAQHLAPAVEKIVRAGKLFLGLGGEHSITPAILHAFHLDHADCTVIQLDAHADLRQEYEGERMSHACAMARVRETFPAVQVGIRNLSIEEANWVQREKLPVFFAHEMRRDDTWMEKALAHIGTEKVYITIDLDVFDSSLMPATGTPEPGGLGWYDVLAFLRLIAHTKRVIGYDIVELAPRKELHACDFLAAKLAYKCIGYWHEASRRKK